MTRADRQPTRQERIELRVHSVLEAARTSSLEAVMADAVSRDFTRAGKAVCTLSVMAARGRREAVVFMLGLLSALGRREWHLRCTVVSALSCVKTSEVADALVAELRATKPIKDAWGYIGEIVDAVCGFEPKLVRAGVKRLEADGVIAKLPGNCPDRLRSMLVKPKRTFATMPARNDGPSLALRSSDASGPSQTSDPSATM